MVNENLMNTEKEDEIPAVAAMYLDEAVAALQEANCTVECIFRTMPPRDRIIDVDAHPDLAYRVVRCVRTKERSVTLTVTAAKDIRQDR